MSHSSPNDTVINAHDHNGENSRDDTSSAEALTTTDVSRAQPQPISRQFSATIAGPDPPVSAETIRQIAPGQCSNNTSQQIPS
eukprot:2363510-Rhodomonas_salina.1